MRSDWLSIESSFRKFQSVAQKILSHSMVDKYGQG